MIKTVLGNSILNEIGSKALNGNSTFARQSVVILMIFLSLAIVLMETIIKKINIKNWKSNRFFKKQNKAIRPINKLA